MTEPSRRLDRLFILGAALFFLGALLLDPLGLRVDPELAVAVSIEGDRMRSGRGWFISSEAMFEGRDPWGRAPAWITDEDGYSRRNDVYSRGPNGLDEGGAGDDIPYRDIRKEDFWSAVTFLWGREVFVFLGLLALFGRFARRTLTDRRRSLWREATMVLGLGLVTAVTITQALHLAADLWRDLKLAFEFLDFAAAVVGVRWPILIQLSAVLFILAALIALSFRLHAPTDAGDENWLRAPLRLLGQAACAITVALLVQTPLIQMEWRRISPDMQAVQAYKDSDPWPTVDPWGTTWCDDGAAMDGRTWSAGPNRIDERGRGDDIVVVHGFCRPHAVELAYLHAPMILAIAAVAFPLLWFLLAFILLGRRAPWVGRRA